MNDIMFSHDEAAGPKSSMTLFVVEFTRWRYRGRSLPSPAASCLVLHKKRPGQTKYDNKGLFSHLVFF